ncbi:MAG: alpha/beta fold hydrolase [Phycisphaerae bacterium]
MSSDLSMPVPPGIDFSPPEERQILLPDEYGTSVWMHAGRNADRLPVLHLHGIQSHPGWFVGSCSHLAGRGYSVYQLTRRGSGNNRRGRGHADSPDQLLDDLQHIVEAVLAETDAEKLHLVGVSWGGKWAAAWLTARAEAQSKIASLTLSAPGISPLVDVSTGTKLRIAGSLLVASRKRFPLPLDDPKLFTDNPPMRDFIAEDPLALHEATARFLYVSRKMDEMIGRASEGQLQLPTSLILAETDPIIDNGQVEQVVRRLSADEPQVVTLPGCHTLDFEPDPSEYYRTLTDCLERV